MPRKIAKFSSMLSAGLFIGAYLGYNIDQYLGTKFLFILLFMAYAIIGSFIYLFRSVKKHGKNNHKTNN